MDPTALNAAAQGQQTGAQSGGLNGKGKLAEDFDTFLGILVTQLQNQDPLEPMKSQEFTNQLVQFSTVEQAIATNSKLDQMLQAQAGNRASQAVNYIGKEIAIDGNQAQLQDGQANFAYTLEGQAETVAIEITNAEGQVVRTLQGDTGAGRHDVSWDGKTLSGKQLPDGVYNVQVYAVDGDGKTVKASTETRGEVTGFEVRDQQIHFQVGSVEVPFDKVTAVYATPTLQPEA
ncbi:MAG: flagellar hook assembly protein FlgD [Rhodovibrio sp.]|nr:flagellar hook assembly protein FlgD [Rhodovibrio sp.]